ncbi:MAG: cupin domain-containing protein [Rhodomicrobium sp.]
MTAAGNIFGELPPVSAAGEETAVLLTREGLRIERIVSNGQASPPGFWYDQPSDEWVIVLAGAARLRFEAEPDARPLGPGDYVFIPAHARHRVDWTDPDRPTVWLAVHASGQSHALRCCPVE